MRRHRADLSVGILARVNPHPRVWRGDHPSFRTENLPGEDGEAGGAERKRSSRLPLIHREQRVLVYVALRAPCLNRDVG